MMNPIFGQEQSNPSQFMKLHFFCTLAIFSILLASCNDSGEANSHSSKTGINVEGIPENFSGLFLLNPEESSIYWTGKEITGKTHEGSIDALEGDSYIAIDNGMVQKATIMIDMNTISCTDLDDDAKASLESHLKSDDFFNVAEFPTATLRLHGSQIEDDGRIAIASMLEVRGKFSKVVFPIEVELEQGALLVSGEFNFDRSKHDIKFRSQSFPDLFPDLGDKLINDEIAISFQLSLKPE